MKRALEGDLTVAPGRSGTYFVAKTKTRCRVTRLTKTTHHDIYPGVVEAGLFAFWDPRRRRLRDVSLSNSGD